MNANDVEQVRANILLVDDQPANLTALEAILERLGETLVRATSGEEALRCLLEDEYAVILMDVQMPGMDGLETAELVRQREKSRDTPIIFITAYERNEREVYRGYSLGAVDYLFKPIVPEVLRSKVSVFVDLFRKNRAILQHSELLREHERHEHALRLAEQRHLWEMDRVRREREQARRSTVNRADSASV